MGNQDIRMALDRHRAASAAGDSEAEHEIYHGDVLVEYPQSGERIRGRHTIQAVRSHHPAKLGFTIRRIQALGDLWITEYVLSSHEQPTQTVSILEFCDGKVARETQYFADPFEAPAWRAQWSEQQEKEFNKKTSSSKWLPVLPRMHNQKSHHVGDSARGISLECTGRRGRTRRHLRDESYPSVWSAWS